MDETRAEDQVIRSWWLSGSQSGPRIFTPHALFLTQQRDSRYMKSVYIYWWPTSIGHISAMGHPIHFVFGSWVKI